MKAKYIEQPKKKVKIYGSYDVVVSGGGPAGIAAAVSAARNGMKVILIEQTGCLGGMSTSGLVPCFCPFSQTDKPLIKGIALEVFERLLKKDGVGPERKLQEWTPLDAEKLKVVYDELIAETRVEVLFFSFVSDVIKKGKTITVIIIENKSGRQAIMGKLFIDCTGDADVAEKAGALYEKGDIKGKMMGATLCFTVAGVDYEEHKIFMEKFRTNKLKTEVLRKAEKAHKLETYKDGENCAISETTPYYGIIGYNYGHVFDVDGTNTKDLTRAMIRGREIAHNYINYARKNIPGMKNAKIVSTGLLPGIRETRRIKGEYKLTFDDYKKQRSFKDNIAIYDYPIDVHNSDKSKKATEKFENLMSKTALPEGKFFGIPFRSLLPKNINNLLVAGRSLSSDRYMQGSARVMPASFAMGQAAGTAAGMAVKKKIASNKINYSELQLKLKKQGVNL